MSTGSFQPFFKLIRIGPSLFAAVSILIAGVLAGVQQGFQFENVPALFIIFLSIYFFTVSVSLMARRPAALSGVMYSVNMLFSRSS